MNVEAILFDLDGVLTDTAEFHYRAWKRLAQDLGIDFPREKGDLLRGVSRRESLAILLNGRKVSENEATKFMETKNEYYKELILQMTPSDIVPGVLELLSHLKKKKVKTTVASVSKNAKTVLQQLALQSAFDAIADGFTVAKSKPEPDIFLAAAKMIGVSPNACVVVEDAQAGIEAAHRAGMAAIGIGKTAIGADVTLPHVGSVKPTKFIALAEIIVSVRGGDLRGK